MGLSSPLTLALLYTALALLLWLRFRNRFTTALLGMVLAICSVATWNRYQRELANTWQIVRARVPAHGEDSFHWPPRIGAPMPDLLLYDSAGRLTRLSSLKGRVLLVELVATGSPASVALAGGHAYGPFENVMPQSNLDCLLEYLRRFGPVERGDPRWRHVQIVIYNSQLEPPTIADLKRWSSHFRLDSARGALVLAATRPLLERTPPSMVPGFYLVDERFVVCAESCGPSPKHNLYQDVIPLLNDLVEKGQTGLRQSEAFLK